MTVRRSVQSLMLAGVLLALAVARFDPSPADHAQVSSEHGSPFHGAMGALQFMNRQRAYPGPDIPQTAYHRAFRRLPAEVPPRRGILRPSGRSTPPEPAPWQPLGPWNVGGRTNALAINPLDTDILLAGSASGGLWRSDTAGKGSDAWHHIDTGFPVLGVNAIAIDPVDTSNVYIGTGEVYGRDTSIGGLYIRTTRGSYGIGILRSRDGGQTWTKSLDWSYDQRRGVLDLAIDPDDPRRLFAGTSEGVFRTADGGDSWHQVLDVDMAVDLVLHPHSADTLFVSCGNLDIPSGQIGIYRSTDGGDTWTQLNVTGSGLPLSWTGKTMLDIYPADPRVVFADVANALSDDDPEGVGLYRSTDGGDHWEELTAGFPDYHRIARYQGWFSHFVVVQSEPAELDELEIVAAGVYMYKSSDGGRTFQATSQYTHCDHHNFTRHPTDPQSFYVTTDGGVYRTRDFGETFSGRNGGYQTTQFYGGISVSPSDPGFSLGGLQDNGTVAYQGTTSWSKVLGGDGGMTALHATNPHILFASTQYCRIYTSHNGGWSWSRINSSMEDGSDVCFIAPLAQAPSEPEVFYAGRTRVYRSPDYGATWSRTNQGEALDGDPVLSLSVYPGDPDIVWATTVPNRQRAGVFRTTNGGLEWGDVTGNLPDRYPVDIVAVYWDPEVAFVVFSGFGTSHLFRTEDGGATWKDLDGGALPDIPTSAFALDPYLRDHLYVGNDFGVWLSRDGGDSWEPFGEGMPTGSLIMDLCISPADKTLRAASHGLGAWKRELASVAAAGGDVTPPVFFFAPLRNSMIHEYLELYFVPSETLVEPPRVRISDQEIPVATVYAHGHRLYVADHRLEGPDTRAITVSGTDLAGNDSTSTFQVAIQHLDGETGGALRSAGGQVLLAVPAGALTGEEYLLAAAVDERMLTYLPEGSARSARSGRAADGTASHVSPEPLAIWTFQPSGLRFRRPVRLTLPCGGITLPEDAAHTLVLCSRQDGRWKELPSWTDRSTRTVSAMIEHLGTYALCSALAQDTAGPTVGLEPNFPNPFNGSTTIRFTLASGGPIRLQVLNTRGQVVRRLIDRVESAGRYSMVWDGRNEAGGEVATGVYLVLLMTPEGTYSRKVLLVR